MCLFSPTDWIKSNLHYCTGIVVTSFRSQESTKGVHPGITGCILYHRLHGVKPSIMGYIFVTTEGHKRTLNILANSYDTV